MAMLTGSFTSTTNTPDRNVNRIILGPGGFGQHPLYFTQYHKLGTIDKEQWKSAGFSGFGSMPVINEGEIATMDAALQRGTATKSVVDYALGFKVSHKLQRSDEYGLVPQWAGALGNSAASTLRTLGSSQLNRAFNSSYTIGFDSKELCATDHTTAGGTEQNELTTAADLTNSSLDEALYTAEKTVDYRGLHKGFMPRMLVVAAEGRKNAWQILNSLGEQGTTDNDANFFSGRLQLVVDPTLTDSDAWFLIDPAMNPLEYLVREQYRVSDYVEQGSESRVYIGRMAVVFLASDWYGIFGSPGAA